MKINKRPVTLVIALVLVACLFISELSKFLHTVLY